MNAEVPAEILALIAEFSSEIDGEVVVRNDLTRTYDGYRVFFYECREFLETGRESLKLLGNAPLIFDETTRQVTITGTAAPVETYLKEFEAKRRTSDG